MSGEGTNSSLILKTSVCTFLCTSEVLYFWDKIEHINVWMGKYKGMGPHLRMLVYFRNQLV